MKANDCEADLHQNQLNEFTGIISVNLLEIYRSPLISAMLRSVVSAQTNLHKHLIFIPKKIKSV